MSHPAGLPLRDRIDVEFMEADVEIGFSLVDLAKESALHMATAARVLQDAEDVLGDIERRLGRASSRDREAFGLLVSELRREIDLAKTEEGSGRPPGPR